MIEGVDLAAHLRDGEAVVQSERGELRFAAGGDLTDERGESWSVEGGGETVHKTVPLIQTMKSRILIPMSWSPVA